MKRSGDYILSTGTILLTAFYAVCYISFSLFFIKEHFVPFDKTFKLEESGTRISCKLPEVGTHLLKLSYYIDKEDLGPRITCNDVELTPGSIKTKRDVKTSWSIDRKDIKTAKYMISAGATASGGIRIAVSFEKTTEIPPESFVTIRNFISKPITGMYLLADDFAHASARSYSPVRIAAVIASGLLIFAAIIGCLAVFIKKLEATPRVSLVLSIAAVTPVVLFFAGVTAVTLFSPYMIVLMPNYYAICLVSPYLLMTYPCWRLLRKLELFKTAMLFSMYFLLGALVSLFLQFDFLARFFADVAFILLCASVGLLLYREISASKKNCHA